MTDDTPLIQLQGITKTYQKGPREISALDDVDLSVDTGEFLTVVGPSGSGKSTLLNVLSLLVQPSSGTYHLNNKDVSNLEDAEASDIRNREIGFVFQTFNLFPQLTAGENIAVPMQYAGTSPQKRQERANHLAETVGLGDRVQHRPMELSGGERQRVAIARALANRPSLLLSDEPTGNLDEETAEGIIETLLRLNRENDLTIVLVTHDLELASIGTRKIQLRDGRLQEDTTINENSPHLR